MGPKVWVIPRVFVKTPRHSILVLGEKKAQNKNNHPHYFSRKTISVARTKFMLEI